MQEHVASDTDNPFFIYFASQAAHTPWSAPSYLEEYFAARIHNPERSRLAAVVTVLDDTVGEIVDYMKSEESGYLWDNTLIIVSSDNGGAVQKGASNFPLRGGKTTLWEGGVKATAFVAGGILDNNRRGLTMDALMHISDWLPTLSALAGVEFGAETEQELDGFNQLENILSGEISQYEPREILVHNILPNGCMVGVCGAIRWRNWKIIVGKEADSVNHCETMWCPPANESIADDMTIQCSENGDYDFPLVNVMTDCVYNGIPCLFDIDSDPCEYADLRESEPEIYDFMYNLLLEYNESQLTPTLYSLHPADYDGSNPALYNGFWSPWKEVEPDTDSNDVLFADGESIKVVKNGLFWRNDTVSMCSVLLVIIMLMGINMIHYLWTQRVSYEKIADQTENM